MYIFLIYIYIYILILFYIYYVYIYFWGTPLKGTYCFSTIHRNTIPLACVFYILSLLRKYSN